MKRVLIGTPICLQKLYCWEEYCEAISKLVIPAGVEIKHLVVDTTDSPSLKIELACKNKKIKYTSKYSPNSQKAMDKVVAGRNKIFEYALDINADYVFFIDSDVIVPPNTLQELLTGLAQYNPYWSIITGFYVTTTRKGFPTPCAKLWTKIGYMDFPENHVNGKIWEVDMTGLGCTLIPRKVFETFRFNCYRDGKGKLLASEDMVFFSHTLNQRFCSQRLYILFHTGIDAKHITSSDFYWDHETA